MGSIINLDVIQVIDLRTIIVRRGAESSSFLPLGGMIMALFDNRKVAGIMADRGLSELSEETESQVEAILSELDSKKLLRDSDTANFTDRSNQEKVGFLRAIMEQNWILISQNEKLLKVLEKKQQE